MLQAVKKRLKKISFIHGFYMRLKRTFGSELLGMTTKTEQDYFAGYGEKIYSGRGEIVDLGCWFGSTTIPLIEGLLKNPAFLNSNKKVYAYDLFIWYDWMNPSVTGTNLVGKYKAGDSFLEEFKSRTARYASYIEICGGDLTQIGWSGQKIEFLLIDAMKSWELSNAILKYFFISLVPNVSYILQQDFANYFVSWIHLLQWKFRDYFELVEEVPKSSSVVFKYTKEIPRDLLSKNYSFESFDEKEVDEAYSYWINLISPEKLPNVAAAKAMFYLHQKKTAEAKKVFENLLRQGVPRQKEMLMVGELIYNN